MAPPAVMGEAATKDEAAPAPDQEDDPIVAAAGRIESACRDLTACLRALPGVAERRAAALLLRAAAVSGRLHLKDAIRLLDAAWAEDPEGPLHGEPRVVPETPEQGSLDGGSDREDPLPNGAAEDSDEKEDMPNAVINGSATEDVKSGTADAEEAGQKKSKRKKKSSSESDDSTRSPVKNRSKKKRCVDSEGEDGPSVNAGQTSPMKAEPCDDADLVISKTEPLSQSVDSEEAIVKTEPEVAAGDEPGVTADADEPEMNADEPEMNADELEMNADEPEMNAEEPEMNADEPEASLGEPEAAVKATGEDDCCRRLTRLSGRG